MVPSGWDELLAEPARARPSSSVPFDHPLWVLYSSGTTGLPKAIVQGQGGILLEHLKKTRPALATSAPGDRFFWFTTTGWMMWNFLVGRPARRGGDRALRRPAGPAAAVGLRRRGAASRCFGTSAGFIGACMKAGVEPPGAAGRPAQRRVDRLAAAGRGLRVGLRAASADVWLFSTSGGTDLCTAFVGGCPLLPVYAGELQARCLGASVEAWDEDGRPLVDEVGELVITKPMPSMPLLLLERPGRRALPRRATSTCTPACGATATGSRSPSAARR